MQLALQWLYLGSRYSLKYLTALQQATAQLFIMLRRRVKSLNQEAPEKKTQSPTGNKVLPRLT